MGTGLRSNRFEIRALCNSIFRVRGGILQYTKINQMTWGLTTTERFQYFGGTTTEFGTSRSKYGNNPCCYPCTQYIRHASLLAYVEIKYLQVRGFLDTFCYVPVNLRAFHVDHGFIWYSVVFLHYSTCIDD